MIATIGDLVEDIVVRLHAAIAFATDTPSSIERRRGGSAANMAVAVAEVGRAARFIGQVGDDRLGDALIDDLRGEGVEVVARRGGRTGSIVVLLDERGERTMLTDRGACAQLAHPEAEWLAGASALHVPWYSLLGGDLANTAATLVQWSHERGISVSIDLSSTSLIRAHGSATVRELLRSLRPDVVFCNQDEFDAAGGAGSIVAREPWTWVVKGGSGPTSLFVAGADPRMVAVPTIAGVRDTTGAGDAFAAGYLCALLLGAAPVEAAEAAHVSARSAIVSASAAR